MAQPAEKKKKPPYVGPRSIEANEYFFGRDKEIRMLENRLLANRVLLLHSLSGAGKTSLLQAGLAPRLRNQDFHILPVVRVSRCPPYLLKRGNPFIYSTLLSLERGLRPSDRMARRQVLKLSLAEYLKQRLAVHTGGDTSKPVLLVFDQFEEILSLEPFEPERKKAFFAWLMPALLDTRYHVLFAMRDDYIGGLEPYLGFFPGRLAARFRLEFLDQTGALEAIQKPAAGERVEFLPDAARALADDLRTMTVYTSGEPRSEAGPYVEPMQLQLACLKIWKGVRPQPGEQINEAHVRKYGSVDNAVQEYYDDVLERIASKDLRTERALRDWIQSQLIVEDRFRFQAYQGFLKQYEVTEDLVRLLAEAHLVRSEQRLGATWYELSHDRMVKPIVEANRRWRESHLKDWQLLAERWKNEGSVPDSVLLLKGQALKNALAEFKITRDSQVDRNFLTACERAHQEQSKRWKDPQRLARVRLGTHLDEVGWGIIFPQNAPAERREALKELLDLRREQAGLNREEFFHLYEGSEGYRPGEKAQQFLGRHKALGGQINPENVPYYLLLAGGPEEIPFDFQYGLDQQYAVGRIAFEKPEQYQSYARSVLVCEGGTVTLPNRAVIFTPRHPGDQVTDQVASLFSAPLIKKLSEEQLNWQVDPVTGDNASRAALLNLLGGPDTPAALIAVTWGVGEPYPSQPEREEDLGGLVAFEWPGPKAWQGPLDPGHYLAARDIDPQNARLLGLIAMLASGYSAGAPLKSDFAFLKESTQPVRQDTLARLPQALLGHPRGGALAVIAHVDKIFTSSFFDENNRTDIHFYLELVKRLMSGSTIGAAMEQLNQRYTLASAVLQETLLAQAKGEDIQPAQVRARMIRAMDARNYILFGDPAARLPVNPDQKYADPGKDWRRPEIERVVPIVERAAQTAVSPPAVEKGAQPAGETLWYASGVLIETGEFAVRPLHAESIAKAITQDMDKVIR